MIRISVVCTGCNACVSICPQKCITMRENEEGFLSPEINCAECIHCNLCDKVCPVIHEPDQSLHTLAYAVKNRNEKERQASTSGGIFSLLAKNVINQGGMVFGAAYSGDFTVQHTAVTNLTELSCLRGAKYTQSIIGTSFREVETILKSGCQVLFSGTPCQCSGLKAFLGKDYDNLLLADLICHGVPSPRVWQDYIDYRSSKENGGIRPVRINMRSKASGWSRYGYSAEFDYGGGYITRVHCSRDLFMKAFVGNICLRNSCSDCVTKGIERCTDFTLGDYWGVWDQHPEFDDNKGTSIVFVHSEKGKKVLEKIADQIDCLKADVGEAYKENLSLIKSSPAHEKREEFLGRVNKFNFEELIHEYFPSEEIKQIGFYEKIKRNAKNMLKRRTKE